MIVQSGEKYTVYSFSPTLDNIIGNFVNEGSAVDRLELDNAAAVNGP